MQPHSAIDEIRIEERPVHPTVRARNAVWS